MDDDDLQGLLAEIREFLEPGWRAFKDERHPGWEERESLSFGMCRFTAAFLRPVLQEATGRKWSVACGMSQFHPSDPGWDRRNGKPASSFASCDGKGGMQTADGGWIDHYWLTDGSMIVDLTADQAGWQPILVTDVKDSRYLANWKPSFVKSHMAEVENRASGWRRQWSGRNDASPEASVRRP